LASIFPSTPTLGEIFTSNGTSWQWNGEAWTVVSVDSDVFTTIVTSPATQNVVVDSTNDTLTFVSGNNISVTANSANDSITIAALPGVPSGGSAGQILAKLTNTNYDAGWIDGGSIGQSQDVEFTTLQDGDLFVYNSSSAVWENKNLFIHSNHENISAEYLNDSIILSASPIPKASYGSASPSFTGLEREVYYQLNAEENQIVDVYFYLEGDWLLYNDEAYTWATVNLESWQWLIDNSSVFGWEWLVTGAATPGGFDYKTQFVPNIIADIKYQQKESNGDVNVVGFITSGGSALILNALQSGSANINAGLRINRGTNPDVEFRWNEQTDNWEFTSDGSTYKKLGSGAVLYDGDQPDTTDLEVGTLWIDSNEDVGSGLDIQSFNRWYKTLSGSATTISGLGDDYLLLNYTPGLEQVYVNGTLLVRGIDYIGSNTSSIVLTEAATNGDVIEIHAFESFIVADTYTKTQIDNNFLTKGSASSTYLNQSSASSTYLTITNASATYEPNIPYVSGSPSTPVAGTLWIDSSASATPSLKVYNGSTWIAVSGASDAGLHPFFTAGI
jgi:hypothetical protein